MDLQPAADPYNVVCNPKPGPYLKKNALLQICVKLCFFAIFQNLRCVFCLQKSRIFTMPTRRRSFKFLCIIGILYFFSAHAMKNDEGPLKFQGMGPNEMARGIFCLFNTQKG